jgi:Flp pilus assembly pilin Flp
MNTTSSKSISTRAELGATMIEFAMIIPVIMLVLVGSLEFTRMLRVYHLAASLSREVANIAMRQCMRAQDAATLQACLTDDIVDGRPNAVKQLQQYGEQLLPGTEVLITVYKYETSDDVTPGAGLAGEDIGTGRPYFTRAAMSPKDEDRFGDPPFATRPDWRGPGTRIYKTKFLLDRSRSKALAHGGSAYAFRASTNIDPATARDKKLVFVGEAFVRHSPVAVLVSRILDSEGARYDASIF